MGVSVDKETGLATSNSFNVDDDVVYCIFDPSHLLKNWKNALMKYDFIVDDKYVKKYNLSSNLVKFKHILELRDFQVNCCSFSCIESKEGLSYLRS